MSKYEYSFDFDMSIFEDPYTTSPKKIEPATSPVKKSRPQPQRQLRVLEETPEVSRARNEYNERQGLLSTVKIMAVALLAVLIIGSLVYQRVTVNDLERKIEQVQSDLQIAESENVRLTLMREALKTPVIVSEYAEENGMIQRDSYKINYFDLSEEDIGYVLSE